MKRSGIGSLLFGIVLVSSICSQTGGQSKRIIENALSGTVVAANNRSPLKDARVWVLDEYSDTQFVSNPDKSGRYSLNLPEGYYFVVIGAGGYNPVSKSIWVFQGKTARFSAHLSVDEINVVN
jgi:hypothetical protein